MLKIASTMLAMGFALSPLAARAQSSPDQIEAKKIFADLIAFRSSEGRGQVGPMAEYIVKRLRHSGVPGGDIAELPMAETLGLIVRLPGCYAGSERRAHDGQRTDVSSCARTKDAPAASLSAFLRTVRCMFWCGLGR